MTIDAKDILPSLWGVLGAPNDIRGFSADLTGNSDTSAAFNQASTKGSPINLPSGTYFVNSNITITPNVVFQPGAVLKPGAGTTITLSKVFNAGNFQIFDLSLGGVVLLPAGITDAYVDWWGAQAFPSAKVSNEFAFNAAWWALAQTPPSGAGVNGGRIRVPRGDYFISGTTYSSDNVSMQGEGYFYSLIKANSATWSGTYMHQSQSVVPITFTDNGGLGPASGATSATLSTNWLLATTTYPVVFFERGAGTCEQRIVTLTQNATTATWSGGLTQNCTANAMALTYNAIFNNTVRDLRLDAASIAGITANIYAPAWQQQSGMDGLYLSNFMVYGLFMDNGYGGAAQLTLRRSQFFSSILATSGIGIRLGGTNGLGGSVGRLNLNLQELQFASFAAPITFTAAPPATAVSATLNANWPNPSGVWNVQFVETAGGAIESRNVTLTNGATTATWVGGLTNNCNAAATGISPNSTGLFVNNSRITLNCSDIHFEQLKIGFDLDGAADVCGTTFSCDGNPSVSNMFQMENAGPWTGSIDATEVRKAGALAYINDNTRTITLAGSEPQIGVRLVWPPSASIPVGVADVLISAGVGSYGYREGVFSAAAPNRTGAGVCVLTLATTMDSTAAYDVIASSHDAAHPQLAVAKTSATTFTVSQFTPGGVAGDASEFTLKVFRRST